MARKTTALAGVFMLTCASVAPAQSPSADGSPVTAPAPATALILSTPNENVLRTGTAILLTTSEGLTTKGKKLKVGQRVQLEVAEAVMVNGHVIIPAGSPAVGEITTVRNKGMWGKSGGINGRILYARVNGRQIRLTGQFDDKGKTGTAGVVAAVALIPIAGFFTTGTSAEIPLGTPVKSFLDEDIAFAPPALTPAVAQIETVLTTPAVVAEISATDTAQSPALVTKD